MKSLNEEGNGSWVPWLLGAGIGAACMYLSDPETGARRRALLRDKLGHASRLAADGLGATTRDISHRVQGTWASTRSRWQPGEVSDDVLVERVRATLGRYVSHPRAIDVYARNGCVELRGKILKREVDRLMYAVRAVPGVCEIDNLLEDHESPGNIPSLQGGISRPDDRFEVMQANWTPAVRIVVGSVGSALAGYGAVRRDLAGALLAGAGAGLILRAATNLQTTPLVGVGAGHRAIDIQKTVRMKTLIETGNAPRDAAQPMPQAPGPLM